MNSDTFEKLLADITADQAGDAELQRLQRRSEALAAERLALGEHVAALRELNPAGQSLHAHAVDTLVSGVGTAIGSPAELRAAQLEASARDRQIADAVSKVDRLIDVRRVALYREKHAARATALKNAAAIAALKALCTYGRVLFEAQTAAEQINAAAGVQQARACSPMPMTRQGLALALESVVREGAQVPQELADEIRGAATATADAVQKRARAARDERQSARKQRIHKVAAEAAARFAQKRAEWLAGVGIEPGGKAVGWSASR